ncbi:MAG: dephospho-CoA kinase [Sulfobacillus acidophilus]|uniref:Dephospho-CoA kinase n=1 Tax=Sulfobacillus acidophilus TaxID=53633 RepID=A0A2T2WDX0_9FIRM|nr:MAG: dephospho-CoA kinase [Sulfobacillus acidophilus]
MRLIGLTGGIGSGKSSVSHILAKAGAYIIDADDITHQLQYRGEAVWKAIVDAFGWPVLLGDGQLDRKRLGHIVFNDVHERARLNAIVHPAVQREIRRLIATACSQGVALTVLDVPLLIEGGLYQIVDEVWVVYADPDQQIARICARDNVSEGTARRRLAAQMPLADKLSYAQRVIDNRGSLHALEKVVRSLWQSAVSGG